MGFLKISTLGLLLNWICLLCYSKQPLLESKALRVLPHDDKCFTQGLEVYKSVLVETCGLYGKSNIRIVDPASGKAARQIKFRRDYFAEGLTIRDDLVYVLTWKRRVMIVVDLHSFKICGIHHYKSYTGEGWGLATDGQQLFMSDGSHILSYFEMPTGPYNASFDHAAHTIENKAIPRKGPLNIATKSSTDTSYVSAQQLKKIREVPVRDPLTKRPIKNLNELEYVNGFIYANVWFRDIVLKINAKTGIVDKQIDLSHLYPRRGVHGSTKACMNGIAYNASDHTFLQTGKLWPKSFVIAANALL